MCRSNVDDASPFVGEHGGQREANGVEGGAQIDGENGVPLGDRERLQRGDMLDAGIVDQHIEPAEAIERHGDHFGDRVRLRHVGAGIGDRDAEIGAEGLLRRFDLVGLAEAVEHDCGARGGKRASDAKSNAAGESVTKATLSLSGACMAMAERSVMVAMFIGRALLQLAPLPP